MLDTSRAFTGPAARRRLAEAIRDGGTEVIETDWLEWKSEADLSDPKWAPLIGLYVLGFANRMPDVARRWAEGFAYLAIGVEPGKVTGVKPIDPAKLEGMVEPYVGLGGPRWEPHYVEVDGVTILVVEVAPPRWGDGAHPMRKEYAKRGDAFYALAGEIFVRRGGKTPRASPAEIDALNKRARRAQEVLEVQVEVEPGRALRAIDPSEADRDAWLTARRQALLGQIGDTRRISASPIWSKMLEDGRTPEQFTAEVDDYVERVRAALVVQAQINAVRRRVAELICLLQNPTDNNFSDVRVDLYLEGDVQAYFSADDVARDFAFPAPPRAYGTSELLETMRRNSAGIEMRVPLLPGSRRMGGSIDNSGSSRIRFDPIALRPRDRRRLAPVRLVIASHHAGTELIGRWSATATNVNGVASGAIRVPVAQTLAGFDELKPTTAGADSA